MELNKEVISILGCVFFIRFLGVSEELYPLYYTLLWFIFFMRSFWGI